MENKEYEQADSFELVDVKETDVVESPLVIMDRMRRGGASIEDLKGIMAIQKEWEENEAKKAYYAAFARFKKKMPKIEKVKAGYGYKYAPLSEILEKVSGPLSEEGLLLTWGEFDQSREGYVGTVGFLTHSKGYREKNIFYCPLIEIVSKEGKKALNPAQSIGAAIEYGRRYTACALLGIAPSDEDTDAALPIEYISEEEAKGIDDRLAAIKADKAAFLKYMGVNDTKEIQKPELVRALNSIKALENAKGK